MVSLCLHPHRAVAYLLRVKPAFGGDVGALDKLPLQFVRQRQPNKVLGHAVPGGLVFAFAFVLV